MSEASLVRAAILWANGQERCWAFKTHGSPYQRRGIPDVVGYVDGRFFAAEAKSPGKKLTPIQEATIHEIANCGGWCFVFRSLDEFRHEIELIRSQRTVQPLPWNRL